MKKNIFLVVLVSIASIALFGQTSSKSSKQEYLLIFRFKSNFVPSSPDAVQTNIKHWQQYMGNLAQTGKLVSGFRPTNEGKTITGSDKITKEGVYVADNELVSSFIVVNAVSMDEASEIAKNCPIFEFNGSVEIRPIMQTTNN